MKKDMLDQYNVVWTTPSTNSSESMPVGGHDIGLNVWVENEEILFYIDRSGSFDENNQLLKLGRGRLRLNPNPFAGESQFRQELKLREGIMEIEGKTSSGLQTMILIWVETYRPVVHVEVMSSEPLDVAVSYENWRMQERELPYERRHPCLSTVGYPGIIKTEPDNVHFDEDAVLFYHRNRNDSLLFDKVVEQQGLTAVKDQLWNPQKDLIFGGKLAGDGFVPDGTEEGSYMHIPYRAWRLKSSSSSVQHKLNISLHTAQSETLEEWIGKLNDLIEDQSSNVNQRDASRAWWASFWDRSYIHIQPEQPDVSDQTWQVGRNYQLFRYMLGCNAFGRYPTKFNGGLFTTDPSYVMPGIGLENESADYRLWGGGNITAQNQRLVYWPMLRSGDFDLMPSQFDFYMQGLGNAELRTRIYWEHDGCSFTEQLENFGLPVGWCWGWRDSYDPMHRRAQFSDPTEQVGPWVRYQYVNQLEFAFMIIKYYQYSTREIEHYMPFVESAIRFFDEHYQYRHYVNTTRRLDVNGHLVIFPSTACETYKNATNPIDVVSALTAVVQAILELPIHILAEEKRRYYESLKDRIPPIPYRERNGKNTIAPAESWTEIINVEIPQLYPVFPYELFGLGKDALQVAIDTWNDGVDQADQKNYISWHQDNIFCARLGLTDEAAQLTILKLQDGKVRFPAFWGPGHDWLPDHNWGGSGMIGLQDMLLQTSGAQILLLPAWPKDWDVDFKLHAPANTVVEGKTRRGRLVELRVTPESRLADVVNVWECGQPERALEL